MTRKARPRAKSTASAKSRPRKRAAAASRKAKRPAITAKMVQGRVAYLEISVAATVTEDSVVGIFESVRKKILGSKLRRVLVDVRQGRVDLTISDLLDLAKRVAALAGSLERLAMVLRPQDLLAEKFFEPSVSSRGIPTLVTVDADEAVYWLTSPLCR